MANIDHDIIFEIDGVRHKLVKMPTMTPYPCETCSLQEECKNAINILCSISKHMCHYEKEI